MFNTSHWCWWGKHTISVEVNEDLRIPASQPPYNNTDSGEARHHSFKEISKNLLPHNQINIKISLLVTRNV